MRTVLAYEAHWLRKAKQLGPLYQGMRPATLQARIVLIARKLNDLLTPAPGADAMSADDAIATLESEAADPSEVTVIRLLVSALGIFPTGTLVQLGSTCVLYRASANARVVIDETPVDQAVLKDGDVVQLGRVRVVFKCR